MPEQVTSTVGTALTKNTRVSIGLIVVVLTGIIGGAGALIKFSSDFATMSTKMDVVNSTVITNTEKISELHRDFLDESKKNREIQYQLRETIAKHGMRITILEEKVNDK